MFSSNHISRVGRIAAFSLLASAAFVFGFYQLELAHGDLDNNPEAAYPVHGTDSPEYVELARSIEEGEFALGGKPETLRTPGYPAFLAFFQKVGWGMEGALWVQVLLHLIAVIFVYCLGVLLLNARVGEAAAYLYILDPSNLATSHTIMSEALFMALMLGGLFAALRFKDAPGFVLAGILVGLSILVRPAGIVFLPAIAFATLLFQISWKKRIALSLVSFIACGAVLLPWVLRNKEVVGVYGVSSSAVYNLYAVELPIFIASRDGISREEARVRLDAQAGDALNPGDLADGAQFSRVVREEIARSPVEYVKFRLGTLFPFFFASNLRIQIQNLEVSEIKKEFGIDPAPPSIRSFIDAGNLSGLFDTLKRQAPISLERILLVLIFICALGALCIPGKRRAVIFLWVLVGLVAVSAGALAGPRIRMPALPFYYLLAVFGAEQAMLACASKTSILRFLKRGALRQRMY